MDTIIGYCGIVCDACPALKAKKTNDDELRKKTAEEWSEAFKTPFKPEDINCDGCISDSDRHIGHCQVCEIRKCGKQKGIENCAHCDDYVCEKLEGFFKMVPDAQKHLDAIKSGI